MIGTQTRPLFATEFARLPTLHRDETLYSWFGRTHLLTGRPRVQHLSTNLLGSRSAALAHDIPSRLAPLASVSEALASSDSLAAKHTVFGYYYPWWPERLVSLARREACDGSESDVQMRLGLPATRLGKHPLKACLSCIDEERAQLGYARWHVEHQFPSVWICDKHQEVLRWFLPERSFRHERRWFRPEPKLFGTKRQPQLSAQAISTLLRLRNLSKQAVNEAPSSLLPDGLGLAYRRSLYEESLLTAGGRVRMRHLLQRLTETYCPLRSFPGFDAIDTLSEEWAGFVGSATRATTKPIHPMKHLMMINLLFGSWDAFIATYRTKESKRTNSLTPEVMAPDSRRDIFVKLVRDEGLSISSAGRQVCVTATTAVRWAKLEGLTYTPRTKRLSAGVLKNCRTQLRRGLPKQQVATDNGVSIVSITRLLSSEPLLREEWQAAIHTQRRSDNRRRFSALLADNPGVPLRLLRKMPNNGYMWLYRHDPEWLAAALSR